jgi:drug/metabolite transporter (DMT)-like permease
MRSIAEARFPHKELDSPGACVYIPGFHEVSHVNVRGLAHLLIVYVVWGSTYLAIRIAVREGSGFPPFYMAGTRIIIASCILFLLCKARGKSLRPTRRDWYVFAASGVLLWFGGNGLVSWAEMRAASGYAAVLVGSQPLWTIFLESVIDRRRPTWQMIAALVVGLAGIVVLNYPCCRIRRMTRWRPRSRCVSR